MLLERACCLAAVIACSRQQVAGFVERGCDEIEHAGELREEQDAATLLDEFRQLIE